MRGASAKNARRASALKRREDDLKKYQASGNDAKAKIASKEVEILKNRLN